MGEKSEWKPARLREAHAHVYAHGRSLDMVNLDGCRSQAQMLDGIRGALEEGRKTVLAHGARPEAWQERDWPSLADLDALSGDATIAAWCFDYHALMANSKALQLARIEDDTPDPPGGQIGRDDAWHLNGVVYEAAAGAVWNAIEPSEVDRMDLTDGMISIEAHAFKEIHDLKSQPGLGPKLKQLIYMYSDIDFAADYVLYPLVQDLPEILKTHRDWQSDQIRLGGGKIFVDGTLNSRTAWMLHPFADGRPEHPSGMQLMSDTAIEDAIRLCAGEGLQLAAHAIGDAAVRAVLDAAERARAPRGSVRIEHAELIDEADVPRFAELGVIASVQPCHLLYDIEALRRACPDRLDRVLPIRELIDSGLTPGRDILFGSDTPIVRPDPEDSILAATNRGRSDMALADGIAPSQAISEAEAWACFDADA
ncbi:MAG: amidohydrolase family protein [Phycisphaerales bacterium]|nr:amidohydrolase family protein [Phycisphaerales bacterium]